MAIDAALEELLSRAADVFHLAESISRALSQEERWRNSNRPGIVIDQRLRQELLVATANNIVTFKSAVLEFRDAIHDPPAGFTNTARELRKAAVLVREFLIYETVGGGLPFDWLVKIWYAFEHISYDGFHAIKFDREGVKVRQLVTLSAALNSTPQVVTQAADGLTTGEIAELIGVYPDTVAEYAKRAKVWVNGAKGKKYSHEKFKAILHYVISSKAERKIKDTCRALLVAEEPGFDSP